MVMVISFPNLNIILDAFEEEEVVV